MIYSIATPSYWLARIYFSAAGIILVPFSLSLLMPLWISQGDRGLLQKQILHKFPPHDPCYHWEAGERKISAHCGKFIIQANKGFIPALASMNTIAEESGCGKHTVSPAFYLLPIILAKVLWREWEWIQPFPSSVESRWYLDEHLWWFPDLISFLLVN